MNAAQARVLERARRRTPESDVLDSVLRYLALRHVEHTRIDAGWQTRLEVEMGRQHRANLATGIPDVVGTLPWGQSFAIEVKRAGGRLRKSQAAWILKQPDLGVVIVADLAHDVLNVLEELLGYWKRLIAEGVNGARVNIMWTRVTMEDAPWIRARDQAREMARAQLGARTIIRPPISKRS